jgi:hypothetical protein
MLVLAGWLVARAHPTSWQVALLVAGFALLQLVLTVLAVPILVAEVLLLASLIWRARHHLKRKTPVPLHAS